ncbi:hypothetical protein L596_002489 [Steinernema carpocapsae]|uniref:Uncharacterized protein n=1 Tax=Steinernema carpocapsae TaxID=34508 RepID=A0A4U8UPN2_STECR|nr:hypothetical protein L596_002489 [Steinernema carpocapsae]
MFYNEENSSDPHVNVLVEEISDFCFKPDKPKRAKLVSAFISHKSKANISETSLDPESQLSQGYEAKTVVNLEKHEFKEYEVMTKDVNRVVLHRPFYTDLLKRCKRLFAEMGLCLSKLFLPCTTPSNFIISSHRRREELFNFYANRDAATTLNASSEVYWYGVPCIELSSEESPQSTLTCHNSYHMFITSHIDQCTHVNATNLSIAPIYPKHPFIQTQVL